MHDEANLTHLIYISKAIDNLSKQDLRGILSSSQRNNFRLNITGILVFSNGKFMQFLEGSSVNIMKTFETIKNDFRHHSIDVVRHGEITGRQFEDWHMRHIDTDEILENSGIIYDKLFSTKEMTEDVNNLAIESSAWLLAFKHANAVDLPYNH